MSFIIPFISIVVLLMLIGIFVGIETVFISANKLSLELNKKHGNNAGITWAGFAEKPTQFVSTILIIVNVLLVIYGLLIGQILFPVWHFIENNLVKYSANATQYLNFIRLFVETILATIIILFIYFIFKALFRARSSSVLSNGLLASAVSFFYTLFNPTTNFFIGIAEWILQYIFNIKVGKNNDELGQIDYENITAQKKINNEEHSTEISKELFENALSLRDIKLRACLVPRKEIISLTTENTIEDAKKNFEHTKLSKLVVYNKDIDNIIGYIHQLDLFKSPKTINEILLPIPTVPETMSATDLMTKFTKERKSIAWVIDEFGGTAGIVTMEDLLEEIFGEIKDEYDDEEDFVDKQLSLTEYLFSGRIELDLIAEKYGLVFLEEETAETLSGYIIQHNENIPKEKEQIIIGNYEFDIISMSDTKIETVKLKILRKAQI